MIDKERKDEFWYLIDNDLLDEVELKFSVEEMKSLWYMEYNENFGDKSYQCKTWSKPFTFEKVKVEEYKPNIEPDEFLDSLE